MTGFKAFLKSGHSPTLFASFLYFSFSCCIWVLNGAMAPFISETYSLSPAEKGLMLSVPIIAGALMRFPLGVLAQYIGRKNATLVEMALIAVAMAYGFFMVDTFDDLLAMGIGRPEQWHVVPIGIEHSTLEADVQAAAAPLATVSSTLKP